MRNELISAALKLLNDGEFKVSYLVECSLGKYGPFVSGKTKKSNSIASKLNKIFASSPDMPGNLKELEDWLTANKKS